MPLAQPAPYASAASVAKGTGLLGIVRSIRQRYGDAGVRATFELLPGEAGEAFRFGHVVPVGWSPVAWYGALLDAARRGLRADELLPFRPSHDGFAGWRGFDRNVWLDTRRGVAALLEIRGAKNVEPAVAAGGRDGCDDLGLAMRWG